MGSTIASARGNASQIQIDRGRSVWRVREPMRASCPLPPSEFKRRDGSTPYRSAPAVEGRAVRPSRLARQPKHCRVFVKRVLTGPKAVTLPIRRCCRSCRVSDGVAAAWRRHGRGVSPGDEADAVAGRAHKGKVWRISTRTWSQGRSTIRREGQSCSQARGGVWCTREAGCADMQNSYHQHNNTFCRI